MQIDISHIRYKVTLLYFPDFVRLQGLSKKCNSFLGRFHLVNKDFRVYQSKNSGDFNKKLSLCSDYDLWLRLSLKYRFIALAEPTFKRRRHPGNLSARLSEKQICELKVLEKFYYEKGGCSVIPEKNALRRFSEEKYRVGKSFLKENKTGEAVRYFRASFNQNPNLKALWIWAVSSLKQKLK